jgi:uncharacterized repeat protein (TIGR04138 family)
MQTIAFEERFERFIAAERRFPRDAYVFLLEALDHTQQKIARDAGFKKQHVSGQQLLDGIREAALKQFGPMAADVLDSWGIHRCGDFGDMVFYMIDHSVLRKNPEDSRADFEDGYDFQEAFRKPFLPREKQQAENRERRAPAA